MEEEKHSFGGNEGRLFDFPGNAQHVLFSMIDWKETLVRGPTALEKPLTGCVSRTQPLVCFQVGRVGIDSVCLWTSMTSLNPVTFNLGRHSCFHSVFHEHVRSHVP